MAKTTEAAAKKTTAKKAPAKRTTQKLTISQTKVVEAQFDTRLKDITALDGKLTEIEARFDNNESFVPAQVTAARLKLGEAVLALGQAKDEFAKIGEQYRTFFG